MSDKKTNVDFDEKLKQLDGTPIEYSFKDIITKVLGGEVQSEPIKAYAIALKVYKNEGDTLTTEERAYAIQCLTKTQMFTPIGVAQTINFLENK